jgi:single-stranded-DNA-specific exonuclease
MQSKKLWRVSKNNQQHISNIIQNIGISDLLAVVLANRGYTTLDEIRRFLRPDISQLHSPFLMKDMKKAVSKIISEIGEGGKIIIYGDYDVDGITSTSVLYDFLQNVGADVEYYIPDRLEDGYGLNLNVLETLCKTKPALIITVDCGISGVEEIEYINQQGIDVIVTDHHECQSTLPNSYAIINPKQPDCEYPFKFLAGVGVVYKLVEALAEEFDISKNIIYHYLDLVALGTVADIVPLLDENRALVKYGFQVIERKTNLGLKSLCEAAGVTKIDTFSIGYLIAPRINAAGRIGQASRGVELFTTKDVNTAQSIAAELDQENKNRQNIEAVVLEEVLQTIEREGQENDKIMVVSGEGWHHGVIGIIAGKITERYHKPCIIISFDDEIGRASGRSIEGFNLFEAVEKCSEYLEKFGGHPLAIGLSIDKTNLKDFKSKIKYIANQMMGQDEFIRVMHVECDITKEHLKEKTIEHLLYLEPFGADNPPPLFTMSNLTIIDMRTVGNNKHLKLKLGHEELVVDAIGFGLGELNEQLNKGEVIEALFIPEINEFNGRRSIQLNIKDIKF